MGQTVLFLATNRYVNGEVVAADGGGLLEVPGRWETRMIHCRVLHLGQKLIAVTWGLISLSKLNAELKR